MRSTHYDTPTPWLVGDQTADTPRVGEMTGPVVAGLVSPAHLPAAYHVQPEVEQLTERGVPVRVVSATDLGGCEDCADDPSLGHRDAVAVVRATSATGRAHEVKVCPLHVSAAVSWFARQGMMPLVVDVPAMGGRRWFERDTRETWFAIDDSVGVVVSRDVSDTWTVYLHEENRAPVILAARVGLSGPGSARERAEWLGQAVASQYARDAALAADNDTPAVAA